MWGLGCCLVMKLWTAWVATVATVRLQTHGKASEIWVFASAKSFPKIRDLMEATDFFKRFLEIPSFQLVWMTNSNTLGYSQDTKHKFQRLCDFMTILIFHLAWQKGHASLSWVPAQFSTRSCKLVAVPSKWTQSRCVSSFFYSNADKLLDVSSQFLFPVSQQEVDFWMFRATEGMNLSAVSPIIETIVNVALLQNAAWRKWHGLQHDLPPCISLVPKTAYPDVLRICTFCGFASVEACANQCPGQTGSFTVPNSGSSSPIGDRTTPCHSNEHGRQRRLPTIPDCSSSPCIALYFEGSQRMLQIILDFNLMK